MIRVYRAFNNMSQHDLAARMTEAGFRWNQAKVSRIERDASVLRLDEARALAGVFGVTLNDLVREDA